MIMIKKLKLWKDPRYTEECVEIPPKGSRKLPPADWVNQHEVQHEGEEPTMEYYDLRPRKGSTLSALELPLSFSETCIWDTVDQTFRCVFNIFIVKFFAFAGGTFKLINDVFNQHHVDEEGEFFLQLVR